MRYKGWKLTAAVAVIGAGVWAGFQWPSMVEGDGNAVTPGGVDDPVVTKSYVDQKIAAITGASPGSGTNTGSGETKPEDKPAEQAAGNNAINIVTVPVGKTIIAKDGAQMVVRAGKAVAYSPDSNGIADVTDGTDIKSGSRVLNNHLILFPRGGRGILPEAGQKYSLTVMVIGEYEIKVLEQQTK
ncbi:hypothetical protein [Paenibacillus nasutitermitis]|uniref:Uncharacterized protein n=1 Tax=Paenibacillus nasutitermitis TaxID=1652958 RepID=A0A917E1H8_9BACL|nr:hypothetical protein [Paenibacillus nasutitermitis]GGD92387.1 hypothetical protein GCM10010911_58760 [Paenibacillus nasutitermitis]